MSPKLHIVFNRREIQLKNAGKGLELKMNRWHLLSLVLLIGLCYGIVAYFKAQPISWELILSSSMVAAIAAAVIWTFDRWLWKLSILHPWFVSFANINGTWKIQTSKIWTEEEEDTFKGIAEIDQRFFFYINIHKLAR